MAYSTLKMFGETPEVQEDHRLQREAQPRVRCLSGPLSMFTAEQLDFAAAVERFCADNCATFEQRAQLTQGLSNSPELLQRLAELGWLGVSIPVDYGGGGAGMVEECIFLEETARGLAPIHAYGTGLHRCANIFAARHRSAEEGGRRQPMRRPLRGDRVVGTRRRVRSGCAAHPRGTRR